MNAVNALGAIADMKAAFTRATGRPPARIKVGHDFLMKLATETWGLLRSGPTFSRLSLEDHWQQVLDSAKHGQLMVYGMKVEYQPPLPGLEHG